MGRWFHATLPARRAASISAPVGKPKPTRSSTRAAAAADRRAADWISPSSITPDPAFQPCSSKVLSSVAAYASPARLVSRGGRWRGNAGTLRFPGSPCNVVYRIELPVGPSVITRIETCQATSSRPSRLSHSRRLQLRTSIDPAKPATGDSRSVTFRIVGAKNLMPAPGAAKTRAARRFGSEATTRRSHCRAAFELRESGSKAAWHPRKPIGSLSPNPPLVMSKVQSAQ